MLKLNSSNLDNRYLTSFRVTGEIIGDGRVEVYLEEENKKYLVYENIKGKNIGMEGVTGMAVKDEDLNKDKDIFLIVEKEKTLNPEKINFRQLYEDEIIVTNAVFENYCIETCSISTDFSKPLKLIFKIEKGKILRLNSIVYTLSE